MVELNGGSREKRERRRFKKVEIIWKQTESALLSPGQLSLLVVEWWLSLSRVACMAGGVILPSFIIQLPPNTLLCLLMLLCSFVGLLFLRFALSHLRVISRIQKQALDNPFFFSFENSTLACNFQSSGLHGWKKGSLTAHPRLTQVKDFLRVISYMPTKPQGRVKRDQPEWSFLFPLQRSFPQEYVQSFSSRIDCFRDLVYKLVYLLKMS